uniref:Uncharacterized protein n=1 Tax=Arion vulgaris TaxID=1028688 RepID=A0A0B6ZIZ4_9EUPU
MNILYDIINSGECYSDIITKDNVVNALIASHSTVPGSDSVQYHNIKQFDEF